MFLTPTYKQSPPKPTTGKIRRPFISKVLFIDGLCVTYVKKGHPNISPSYKGAPLRWRGTPNFTSIKRWLNSQYLLLEGMHQGRAPLKGPKSTKAPVFVLFWGGYTFGGEPLQRAPRSSPSARRAPGATRSRGEKCEGSEGLTSREKNGATQF